MPVPMPIQPKSPPPEVIHEMTVQRVVDGDTIVGRVVISDTASTALGITIQQTAVYNGRVRLLSVNAPEVKTPEGEVAKSYVESIIKPGDIVQTRAARDLTDQFGRLLADVWYLPFQADRTIPVDYRNLAVDLLALGYAEPMNGKKLEKLAPQLPTPEAEAFVAHVPALVKAARP